MAVQIAKAVGCKVIAVVGGKEKAEVVRGIGADVIVDYRDEGWENTVKKASEGGEGVDVVYDGIGAVESGIRCLKYRGRLIVVGFAARGGRVESVRMNRVLLKGVAVFGYVSFELLLTYSGRENGLLIEGSGLEKTDEEIHKGHEMFGMAS
jgi:NADPH:quinone reductase-like Zn-dependent oxidoreductase